MQLSTRARYAVRAMIELAILYGKGPVLLKNVATEQDISDKYLEQLLSPLRAKGYIHTVRGSKGGYALAVEPDAISLYEIIEVVEGTLAPVACVDNSKVCSRVDKCVTRDVWVRIKGKMVDELSAVSLASLAEEQVQKKDYLRKVT